MIQTMHEASPSKRKKKEKKENNVCTVIYDTDCPIDFTHLLLIIEFSMK